MDRPATVTDQFLEFVAENNVFPGAGPVDQGDGILLCRDLLDQRPQRRDPDAARDQEHLRAPLFLGREESVWSLDRDARAWVKSLQPAAVVAHALDGQTEELVVERRRERERVRPPPAIASQEAPAEILTGARLELVEVAPGHVKRHDTGRLRHDLGHPEAVAKAHPPGMPQAEREHAEQDGEIEPDPIP